MVAPARPLDLRADAEPGAVGVLRRQVRSWLTEAVGDGDVVDDLVLAVSEAVENVVDHAFADASTPGSITVQAVRDDGRVVITVADDGHWQQPVSAQSGQHYRGRGLALIDQLAELSNVTTGPAGTTVTLVHHC